jgi:hypothetical protein
MIYQLPRIVTTERDFHAKDGMRKMFTVKAFDVAGNLLGAEHVFEDEHLPGQFGDACQRARLRLETYLLEMRNERD